jgi:hypothetical protein
MFTKSSNLSNSVQFPYSSESVVYRNSRPAPADELSCRGGKSSDLESHGLPQREMPFSLGLIEERHALYGREEDYFMFDEDELGRNLGVELNPLRANLFDEELDEIYPNCRQTFNNQHDEEDSSILLKLRNFKLQGSSLANGISQSNELQSENA